MFLRDISLSRTEFFLRKTEAATRDSRAVVWEDFKEVLSSLETEVGGDTHGQTDYRQLAEPPFRQRRITPILSSPWVEKKRNILLLRFISRVFLDVFSLQVFLCDPGRLNARHLRETIERLMDELSELAKRVRSRQTDVERAKSNTLKSSCLCYWIEFEDPAELDENGGTIFESVFASSDYKEIAFSFARVGFLDNDEDIEFCILVRDIEKSTTLFNDLLPEYFLSWSKVRNEEALLKQSLADGERETLNEFLNDRMHRKGLSLREIEELNLELSEKRTAFAEKLLDIEFHLRTLEINISNAEKLIQRTLLSERKEPLGELLVKPLRLVAEQTQAYAAYYSIILEKSRITGEKIANDATLRSAVYSRRLAFLFGMLSLVGILQLFPEFSQKDVYLKVIVLVLMVAAVAGIAFRAEIRNWMSKS